MRQEGRRVMKRGEEGREGKERKETDYITSPFHLALTFPLPFSSMMCPF